MDGDTELGWSTWFDLAAVAHRRDAGRVIDEVDELCERRLVRGARIEHDVELLGRESVHLISHALAV